MATPGTVKLNENGIAHGKGLKRIGRRRRRRASLKVKSRTSPARDRRVHKHMQIPRFHALVVRNWIAVDCSQRCPCLMSFSILIGQKYTCDLALGNPQHRLIFLYFRTYPRDLLVMLVSGPHQQALGEKLQNNLHILDRNLDERFERALLVMICARGANSKRWFKGLTGFEGRNWLVQNFQEARSISSVMNHL